MNTTRILGWEAVWPKLYLCTKWVESNSVYYCPLLLWIRKAFCKSERKTITRKIKAHFVDVKCLIFLLLNIWPKHILVVFFRFFFFPSLWSLNVSLYLWMTRGFHLGICFRFPSCNYIHFEYQFMLTCLKSKENHQETYCFLWHSVVWPT